MKHDGWYYLLASATNCCNGPLTGYAVFAARSRNPLGPYKDKTGRSVLAGRVGGSVVLTQNGNRWVGTGHNTGFTDFSGQDWLIYHAVDRNDPYYAGYANQAQDQGKSSGGGLEEQDGLKLRLEANLELEVELKASIRGDLTLSLL